MIDIYISPIAGRWVLVVCVTVVTEPGHHEGKRAEDRGTATRESAMSETCVSPSGKKSL